MPSQIAHMLAGLRASDPVLAGLWRDGLSEPAFRLGCQGPDIFYHNRRTKPGAFLYGTRLHRRGWGAVLGRVRASALQRGWGPDHPGLAFLLGAATHGFLDRQAHPFVVWSSGWAVPGDDGTRTLRHAHAFLERILDVELWAVTERGPLSDCRWQDDLPRPSDFPDDFWTVWADALYEVFPRLSARDHVEIRLRHAIHDTDGFLVSTSPAHPEAARRAAAHGTLHYWHPVALPDWDFLNTARSEWKDPVTGEPRTESFLDLFDRAVDQARAALAVWADPTVDWEPIIGNGSLNLPGPEGENSAPRYSQPWDFETLLDREVRARWELP